MPSQKAAPDLRLAKEENRPQRNIWEATKLHLEPSILVAAASRRPQGRNGPLAAWKVPRWDRRRPPIIWPSSRQSKLSSRIGRPEISLVELLRYLLVN